MRAVAAAAAAIPLVLTLGVTITAAAAGTLDSSACLPAGVPATGGDNSDPTPPMRDLSTEQRNNARTIYAVGAQLGIPLRGELIAIATALQESTLINRTAATDHDSLGLFQQRPSKGWGTPAQILNPVYASTAFYQHLRRVKNWQQMPLTQAAQAVQRSAYPNAYAKWEPLASSIAADVGTGIQRALPADLQQCASMNGWTQPVRAPIVSGFRTGGRPGHDGVDLGAARGTPIKVASAGTVIIVKCNITPASHGCDRDGSPATPGCGWYIDVQHADNVITRYCHMLTRPLVIIGQQLSAGQVIGYVGSSGHSSGPHLHFEVHLHGDRSAAGAIDPVEFMARRAPIGT
jgi:murein DD-endopeptidase MepM/ murein hydrolase activator NlpD